jgi:hypothetical protein
VLGYDSGKVPGSNLVKELVTVSGKNPGNLLRHNSGRDSDKVPGSDLGKESGTISGKNPGKRPSKKSVRSYLTG